MTTGICNSLVLAHDVDSVRGASVPGGEVEESGRCFGSPLIWTALTSSEINWQSRVDIEGSLRGLGVVCLVLTLEFVLRKFGKLVEEKYLTSKPRRREKAEGPLICTPRSVGCTGKSGQIGRDTLHVTKPSRAEGSERSCLVRVRGLWLCGEFAT
jgi:hypothetical protein